MIRFAVLCLIAGTIAGCTSTGGGGSTNTSYAWTTPCSSYDYSNTGTCPMGRQWH